MVTDVKYEPLAETFEGKGSQRGWMFRMVKREGMIAMYEKESEGKRVYEVIRVKRDKGGERSIGGVVVVFEPKERYPSDDDFGRLGWSYGRAEDADSRFHALLGESTKA